MGRTLFVSQNPLERAENLRAVWEAYDGPKDFRHGTDAMRKAERDGYTAIVCDCLPAYIEGKDRCKVVNICHGMTGNKVYGLDEPHSPWANSDAYAQTDYAIAASRASVPIVARQLGIPEDRVVPLGFPRTDAYFAERSKRPGRNYLYAPTYRNPDIGGWLPRIDWAKVDSLLEDDETLTVKRHYFTHEPLVGMELEHVREVKPSEPTTPHLMECDVLITDYSSIMSDAYLCHVPVILTVDDKREYTADRGMYYDYPSAYSSRWLRAEGNEDVLVDMLREAADNGMGDVERHYMELTAGACDGHSTERVCELVRGLC